MNSSLKKFHEEICPQIPIDSPMITAKLIEEISKIKEELRG